MPASRWLGQAFAQGRGVPRCPATASLLLQRATRYHALHTAGRAALACALAGDAPCALRAYRLCGLLGFVECWGDLLWNLEAGPSPSAAPALLRLRELVFRAHHPAAAGLERAQQAAELARALGAPGDERVYRLAAFAAARGSPEGLYLLGRHHDARGEPAAARRAYAQLLRAAPHWAAALVGLLCYARAAARHAAARATLALRYARMH